jgi:hypothetical protein
MRKTSQFLLAPLLAAGLVSWPAIASAQTPSSNPPSQTQTQPQPVGLTHSAQQAAASAATRAGQNHPGPGHHTAACCRC